MAKGQLRSNKEIRKPKADKKKTVGGPATVHGKFAKAQEGDQKKK